MSFAKLTLMVCVAIALAFAWARPVPARADERPSKPVSDASTQVPIADANGLVEQLGASSFSERRRAYYQLLRLGSVAEGQIDIAANSPNRQVAESASRLQRLLRVIGKCNDPQLALQVADLFSEASEDNLTELVRLGQWELASHYLAEHSAIELRAQQNFFQDLSSWNLIEQIVDEAEQQQRLDDAWPIVSRLVPIELAAWTARKLNLSLTDESQDEHDKAVRLLYAGQASQAVQLNISPLLKCQLAAKGFQWSLFADPVIQQSHLGADDNLGVQASTAYLYEIAGQLDKSDSRWREALGTGDEGIAYSQAETQAALEALLQLSPINEPVEQQEPTVTLKPAGFYQLMIALMLSGRTAAVQQYMVKESPQTAFGFAVRDDYGTAFELLGLQSDLSNFSEWLPQQIAIAKQGARNFDRAADANLGQLLPAINLGQVASILASVGHHQEAKQILVELANLSVSIRGESDLWNRCVLRWLHSDLWRDLCIEVVSQDFDRLAAEQRVLVMEKLFPELGVNAYQLLMASPALIDSDADTGWETAFEQLLSLERCDREYFGSGAANTVRAWIYRVIAGIAEGRTDADVDDQMSYAESASLLSLAELANDWEDAATAFELLGVNSEDPIYDFDLFLVAAKVCLKSQQPDVALECIEAVPAGPRDQHWKSQVKMQSYLMAGDFENAEREAQSRWLRMSSISWNSDRSAGYRVVSDFMDEENWLAAVEYAERNFMIEKSLTYYSFWQARQYAIVLEELDRHLESANVLRSVFVEILRPNSPVVRYLALTNDLDLIRFSAAKERLSRAIAAIENSDFNGAKHELDIGFRLHADDVEPVVHCYPRLVKVGQTEFAEQLLAQFESALLHQIQQWPKDAMTLNNLAWMYAKCDLKLDQALELSQQATKLVPTSAVYLDTLAEVQFRRGDVDAALETMRRCVKLDPRNLGYRRNLERFNAALPKP